MPELRLTKAEKDALVEKALREKARRQGANRKARADRIANGRRRIEKTVPALFLPEIRQLVAAVLTELEAGREPGFAGAIRCPRPVRLHKMSATILAPPPGRPLVLVVWDPPRAGGPRPPAAANASARQACRGPRLMSRLRG